MGNTRGAAAFAVWYLRAVASVNFLSAVWVTLGQDVRRHNQADFFTPYLLRPGSRPGSSPRSSPSPWGGASGPRGS